MIFKMYDNLWFLLGKDFFHPFGEGWWEIMSATLKFYIRYIIGLKFIQSRITVYHSKI